MRPGEPVKKWQQERERSVNEPIIDPTMGLSIPDTIHAVIKAQHLDAKEETLMLFQTASISFRYKPTVEVRRAGDVLYNGRFCEIASNVVLMWFIRN